MIRVYNLSAAPKAGGWHEPIIELLNSAEISGTSELVEQAVESAQLDAGQYRLLIQWHDGEVAIEDVEVRVPPPVTRTVRTKRRVDSGWRVAGRLA
jgi:hypothetical protein